jgi:Phage tail-collar fibre protein
MSTPYLQITSAGLALGVSAQAQGLAQVSITTFKLGSAYNYTPDPAGGETALHGTIVYTGTVSSYALQSDGSLLLTLPIPAQVGPFSFGEIGIYTSNGTLLASTALVAPINKYSALSANVASTIELDCYLSLGAAASSFTVVTTGASLLNLVTQSQLTSAVATLPTELSSAMGSISGFRNYVINGGFSLYQRGTSFNSSAATTSANAYTLDRWQGFRNGSLGGQITGWGGIGSLNITGAYSCTVNRVLGDTSLTSLKLATSFETNDVVVPLQGQTVTLSFYGYGFGTAATDGINVQIFYGVGDVDGNLYTGFTAQALLASTTLIASSWTQKTLTFTLPANASQLGVMFSWTPSQATATTTSGYFISAVQLERGSLATAFERRPYAMEQLLAYRYYETNQGSTATAGSYAPSAGAINYLNFPWKIPKRANPTVTFNNSPVNCAVTLFASDVGGAAFTLTAAAAGNYRAGVFSIVASSEL